MTSAEATAVEVIKWVINPSRPVPAVEALNEDALFELAEYHRIFGFVLTRLETTRPPWCPPRLLTRLRVRQHQVRRQARERMAGAREISAAMTARGLHPPIFIKGFAAHALTANPDSLHFSGDLDPFAEDLPAFWDVAHELGYTGKRKDTHEWAKLKRNGTALDVHQHYPILAYPDLVRRAPAEELEAQLNPGHWHLPVQASDLVVGAERILWEDLVAGAALGLADGTEELLFPSPTLLCLIHCVHCFRSSVTRLHYMNPLAGFRLYELLSIRDLIRLPAFDADQFRSLVNRFCAQDAVQLVTILAKAFLGEALLPEQNAPDTPPLFPEHLIFGGWISLQQTDDWLLARSIEQMFSQISANSISANGVLEARDIPRLLIYGEDPLLLPHLEIAWDTMAQSLTLKCTLDHAETGLTGHEMLLHFGHDSFVQARLDAAGIVGAVTQKSDYLPLGQQPRVETVRECGRQITRIACTVPNVPLRSQVEGAPLLPLFFAVRRFCTDAETTQAVTYLPLLLSPKARP